MVYGKSDSGFGSSLELSALDGSDGFVLNGAQAGDQSGWAVSGLGDVNGDGLGDLLIGAPRQTPTATTPAPATWSMGKATAGFGSSLELSTLDGSDGFVLNGAQAGDQSGWAVSGLGDVNGDDIDDLLIGANSADPNGGAGASYVVYGKATAASAQAWNCPPSTAVMALS